MQWSCIHVGFGPRHFFSGGSLLSHCVTSTHLLTGATFFESFLSTAAIILSEIFLLIENVNLSMTVVKPVTCALIELPSHL